MTATGYTHKRKTKHLTALITNVCLLELPQPRLNIITRVYAWEETGGVWGDLRDNPTRLRITTGAMSAGSYYSYINVLWVYGNMLNPLYYNGNTHTHTYICKGWVVTR